MNETYWDTFAMTGNVTDYLRYKNVWNDPDLKEIQENQTGAKTRESDRSDGDGAFGGTDR